MRQIRKRRPSPLGGLAIVAISASLLLGGCQTTPPVSPTVTHVVLMWLKHPERAGDRAQLIRASHSLRIIPGVLRVQAGGALPPVSPRPRQDFDLGVVITFRGRAALRRYEKDPRHLEAMRRYLQPLVRHYEVYNLSAR
ncbi:MAG: Dabb family protein [Chthoniobacterales bacterium]|nr:Dabb family protein [Chthoniobacterales bacterium]